MGGVMYHDVLDGGDLEKTLAKHRFRKRWLSAAEEWLRSARDTEPLSTFDISRGDSPAFRFDVPRSIWEPQLREQIAEARRQLAELDRIVREYVDADLRLAND